MSALVCILPTMRDPEDPVVMSTMDIDWAVIADGRVEFYQVRVFGSEYHVPADRHDLRVIIPPGVAHGYHPVEVYSYMGDGTCAPCWVKVRPQKG